MEAFKDEFKEYACFGDTITCQVNGFDIVARLEHDIDYHIDDDDCHNPDQSITGADDDQFKRMMDARKQWLCDSWHYCVVILSVSKNGIVVDEYAASCGGTEINYPGSDNSHLTDLANDLLSDAVETAKKSLQSMIEKLTKTTP